MAINIRITPKEEGCKLAIFLGDLIMVSAEFKVIHSRPDSDRVTICFSGKLNQVEALDKVFIVSVDAEQFYLRLDLMETNPRIDVSYSGEWDQMDALEETDNV